ncbi:MAG: histidinol-phosphate transaminase [Rickettsiales bacterium]|nr:histidinol-phosphate transaminase [Rickettsiales bacterium]
MIAPTPKSGLMNIQPYKQGQYASGPNARCIKLSSNENPHGPSPKAREAFAQASLDMHRYPDGSCSALRQALAEVHAIDADRIVCGAGSDELLGLIIHAYAGPGDEVLFTEHAFLMYKIYTFSAGATPVEAKEINLRADVDLLLAAVTPKTKLVLIANPNNPTGSYLTNAELVRLREGLPHHVILAIDAAYAECVTAPDCGDGKSLVEATDNTVMMRTFSKVYGLPALRLGWMYGPSAIVDAMNRARSPFNVSSTAQAVGIAAVRDTAYTAAQTQINAKSLQSLSEAVSALGYHVYPSQCNFILVDFASAETAHAMNAHLLSQGIYVRDVKSYKLPTCLRITVGTEEENHVLIEAMQHFAAQAA